MPLLASALFVLLAQSPAPPASVSDPDLDPVVAALADVRAARLAGRDEAAARAALDAALAGLADGPGGVDLLARPGDLGRALALAEGRAQPRPPRGGKVEEHRLTGGSFTARGLDLAVRLPKSDGVPPHGYPLVVSLPEAGERPAAHLRERWASRAALEEFALVVPALPELRPAPGDAATPLDRTPWTRVAVAGRPGGVAHVLAALRFARESFPVDPDRVYLVGTATTTPAALAAADHAPHLFAGVALRSAADTLGPAHNLGNLPTLFVGGGAGAEAFAARVNELGFDNCTRVPTLDEAALLAWCRERPRVALPPRIGFTVGTPYPTRVGWLRVAPNATDTAASASVDRATNAVRVLLTGASAVTLHLSDGLLDLGRPVRVDFEGRQVEAVVARSTATLLERWFDGTSDPGAPYVAELVLAPEVGVVSAGDTPPARDPARDPELGARLADALAAATRAESADPLWELALWCRASGHGALEPEVVAKALRVDPNHAAARAAAGHARAPLGAEVEWFRSEAARDRWLERQRPAVAAALGHVEHAGRWMHPDDREPASRGWRTDPETGLWSTPEDLRRVRQGWARQDLAWLDPAGAARADAGLWRVDGEWLTLGGANRRRAELATAWRIPAWHTTLYTTLDRDVAARALAAMEDTLPALHRVLGVEPRLPLRVAMLRDEEQYDRFAFGDPDGRRAAVHTERLHTVHSAFFAESWFPLVDGERTFAGQGAGYWDTLSPNGDAYGYHAARLAFALSYVDALDPSPKAVAKALPRGPDAGFAAAYEAEKALPRWLRLGAAVYAERYFEDTRAAAEGRDPWWARRWSLENLARQGGLTSVDDILRAELDPDDRLGALRRLLELGALVAFMVDGGQDAVTAAHTKALAGLRVGRVRAADLRALEDVLRASGPAFAAFVQE